MVGELLEVQAQRDRPAYFVFLSDNGMSWGQKGYPLKHVPPATRLPFYVNGPDITSGRTDTLLTNVDIAPTLAELAGAGSPAPDGVSFVPLLRGQEQAGHDELLEIMTADPRGFYEGWAALRTPEWRYVRWDSGEVELYDVTSDRWDSENLAKRHPQRVREMDMRLDEVIIASAGTS
jgi:arylsulfatase A-like enzyme